MDLRLALAFEHVQDDIPIGVHDKSRVGADKDLSIRLNYVDFWSLECQEWKLVVLISLEAELERNRFSEEHAVKDELKWENVPYQLTLVVIGLFAVKIGLDF